MLHINHSRETSRHMKTDCVAMLENLFGFYFFFGQPPAVGEGKLQFVAVVEILFAADGIRQGGEINFTYTLKSIRHNFLFEFKLLGITDMLPFASATNAKVRAL